MTSKTIDTAEIRISADELEAYLWHRGATAPVDPAAAGAPDTIRVLADEVDDLQRGLEASDQVRRSRLFELENVQAERDRLAAENAELSATLGRLDADWERTCAAVRQEYEPELAALRADAAALRNEMARYQGMTMHADHPAVIAAERDRLRSSLEDMVRQFAFWAESTGGYWTGGLSTLEEAFEVLDWDDPSANPEDRCDEPDCMRRQTCWTPTPDGTRATCFEHQPKGIDTDAT